MRVIKEGYTYCPVTSLDEEECEDSLEKVVHVGLVGWSEMGR